MIDKNKLPQAYKEVYEILKYVPKDDYEKIPGYIIGKIKSQMDIYYKYEVTEFDDFQKQNMLKETECILAIFYRDYWATEREKNIIIQNEEQDRINTYKIDLFNIKSAKGNVERQKEDSQSMVVIEKEGVFRKIIMRIKQWFKSK